MSPISSDEEYISEDSDDDYNNTDVERSSDSPTNPSSSDDHVPGLTFYRLCGDNIDIVHQRYMRSDVRKVSSLHYFNSYAIADRVNFSHLSNKTSCLHLDQHAISMMILPSMEDEEALNFFLGQ